MAKEELDSGIDLVRIIDIDNGKEEIAMLGEDFSEGYVIVDDITEVADKPIKMNYLLVNNVYVPLEYIDAETIKKIIEINLEKEDEEARREIAKLVIEELLRKGFKFELDGDCDEYSVVIESPDGKHAEAYIREWHGDATFIGELSLLANTYCDYYKEFNKDKDDTEDEEYEDE